MPCHSCSASSDSVLRCSSALSRASSRRSSPCRSLSAPIRAAPLWVASACHHGMSPVPPDPPEYSSALSCSSSLSSPPRLRLGLRWLGPAFAVAGAPLDLSFVLLSCYSLLSSAPRLPLGLRWLVLAVACAFLDPCFALRCSASHGSVWLPEPWQSRAFPGALRALSLVFRLL